VCLKKSWLIEIGAKGLLLNLEAFFCKINFGFLVTVIFLLLASALLLLWLLMQVGVDQEIF
jgi:hypothetical protein